MTAPHLDWQGERCLVLRWPAQIDVATNAAVHATGERLRAMAVPGLVELVPAYSSLALYFNDDAALDHAAVHTAISAFLSTQSDAPSTPAVEPHVVEVPVCYDHSLAPDLSTAAAALGISVESLISRHSAPLYRVAMLGFAPGFPYLLGLDPGLALPRREQPRARVEAGSVAIGGSQTGIYPEACPGGWQLIGRTPLRLFDPQVQPPCPLRPGDGLRFVPIALAAYAAQCKTGLSA